MQHDVPKVPLDYWNESVFRFYLVRELLSIDQTIDCRTEWNRVDLMIPGDCGAVLCELKFFLALTLRNSSGDFLRFKGGASSKNFQEYSQVIKKLQAARNSRWTEDTGGLSAAYLILAYADYVGEKKPKRSYRDFYAELKAEPPIVEILSVVDSVKIDGCFQFSCKLLEVELL
ncbi:hypothetical protein [Halochromatium roseum]|uniref:hypothetical protein n=1 Tax=Halochromatium roseum TaxID=391920 RepID=UPI0019132947|nr:hypothetical protein [Halochromatium roseum]